MSPVPQTKKTKSKKGGPKPKGKNNAGVVSAPVAVGRQARPGAPKVNGAGTAGGVRVSHKEFVGSVTNGAVTGFAVTPLSLATPGYDLNPACSTLFPWLAGMAPSYERYRFLNVSFKFIPSSPTTTAGRFYAAVDYDYDDLPATSKSGLMTNSTAVEVPVWMEASLKTIPAQLHRDQPFKYVSTNTRSNFVEPRTAYCGFLMCAFDTPTANLVYDIWVEYTVEFQLPVGFSYFSEVTGPVPVTIPVVTTGGGGTKYGFLPITQTVNSVLKVVAPGSGFVPILDAIIGGASVGRPTTAYDVRGLRKTSTLEATAEFNTADAPSDFLVASADMVMAAWDQAGNYLGVVPSSMKQIGAKLLGALWDAPGANLKAVALVHAADMFNALPTAAFVATMLTATSSFGAGWGAVGTKFEF